MIKKDPSNNNMIPVDMQAFFEPNSLKENFFKWLICRNKLKYSPSMCVSFLEKVSSYALYKKLCSISFWEMIQPSTFKAVYSKLLLANLLGVTNYKIFSIIGQEYLKFLNEKLLSDNSVGPDIVNTYAEDDIEEQKPVTVEPISPNDFMAWLVTQPNLNGTIYSTNVARAYVSALRSAPLSLDISTSSKGLFFAYSIEEFDALWNAFRNDPNYQKINAKKNGCFSAGLAVYRRYLEYLSNISGIPNAYKKDIIHIIELLGLKYVDKRNLGGALWIVGGRELLTTMKELSDSGFRFTFKVGGGSSSDFRDAWWCKATNSEHEQKSTSRKTGFAVKSNSNYKDNFDQHVDFFKPGLCAQMRPISYSIKGQNVVLIKQSWSQLLVAITECFIAEGNPKLAELDGKSIYGYKKFFLPNKEGMGAFSLLSNGKWIYTNYNPQTIVTIIRNLCHHCAIELDDVDILCEPKDGLPIGFTQTSTPFATIELPKPTMNPAIIEQLTSIISKYFANGFRLNSPIELMRLRSFTTECMDLEIALTDEELKSYIATCGILFDEKIYVVTDETKDKIKQLSEDYFKGEAKVIFYEEFYVKNESWLFVASVVSEEMLINILRKLFPKLLFTQTYFGYIDISVFAALEGEIIRVWGDDVLRTYDQLAERLQYIPVVRIKSVLAQNADFVWNSVETFSHVSKIDITQKERETIVDATVSECNAHGYVSITDLSLDDIGGRNYMLSTTALHNAVFQICLSSMFDKKGKIITRKGDVFDAMSIMQEYCRSIDKCSLDDLLNYEKEITGEIHRWVPMEAGNTVLVRTGKDTYVADKYVYFDMEMIDHAIGLFITQEYLPLKAFTTFAAFPDCGQTWNLFLLESYCRRFSNKFRFDTPSVNSRNAGTVIRKNCGMDYTEIMTDAVANADVQLTQTDIGKFLYESGYTGRSTNAKIPQIINKLKVVRERMG